MVVYHLFLQHLTSSLLAVAFLSSFGSSMLYGYNLAVVNSPAEVSDTTNTIFPIASHNSFFMQLDWITYLANFHFGVNYSFKCVI